MATVSVKGLTITTRTDHASDGSLVSYTGV